MLSFVVSIAVFSLSLCQARPQAFVDGARPSFMNSGEQYIVGGTDADRGEFPWQLSLQRLRSSGVFSHTCGGSLLSTNYGLCAAHCVDGVNVVDLKVIAGLYNQSDLTGTQTVYLSGYTVHEDYQIGITTNPNDISILNFATLVNLGGNIQPAKLPTDNFNRYTDLICIISGWGRTDASNVLPDILQKASIKVIGTIECAARYLTIIGTLPLFNHICAYDQGQKVGACNGDSGGPLNCPVGGTLVVAGVASWVAVTSDLVCKQDYPSVYTRVSAFLDWIKSHTPLDESVF